MRYDVLFIDLDDTLYDFSANSLEAYRAVYALLGYERWFDSFEHYFAIYEARNKELWERYAAGEITKECLNAERYAHPLRMVGVSDADVLGACFWDEARLRLPLGGRLMPHALEVLDYLRPKYKLYILSNGFAELQSRKMQSAGITHYFDGMVLSEDVGVNKPGAEIFNHALQMAGTTADRALMIGDNYAVDIVGAQGVGIDQVYYDVGKEAIIVTPPTYTVGSLLQLKDFL